MNNNSKGIIASDKNREAINKAKESIKQYEHSDEYKSKLEKREVLEDRKREVDKEFKKINEELEKLLNKNNLK